jgi:ribosomal protein S18 acetylase RimI-like enzyme
LKTSAGQSNTSSLPNKMPNFSSLNPDVYGVYVATVRDSAAGFIYVQFYEWNRLAQIQDLAVEPSYQRQGIASEFVRRAENFALQKRARGIYVDTPTLNQKGRGFYEAIGYGFGYEMPDTTRTILTA